MKLINMAYDYEYDDNDILIDMGIVDIVLVPEFVCNNLNEIVQKFFDWIDDVVQNSRQKDYQEYWEYCENGEEIITVGTENFVKWLNDNYFYCENQESVIVTTETEYNPSYPTAMF